MQLVRVFVAAVVTPFACANALAGPFGLEMGMTVGQLKAAGVDVSSYSGGAFKSGSVPRPHAAFESYMLIVDDKSGLCKVIAIGKDVVMSPRGTQLVDQFESLRDGLDGIYGKGRTVDRLNKGSIWSEQKDWAMSLVRKERVLTAFWSSEHTSPDFVPKDKVDSVLLEARANNTSTGYVTLQYDFDNAGPCLEAKTKKQNSVL